MLARLRLSREQLLAMPQHTYDLPIACVEGWSTTQSWTGVRLRDLAERAGAAGADQVLVESLQKAGSFRQVTLSSGQIADERSLLALRVNGADLSPDHGYPARVIVPAAPGVHCTKWVDSMHFEASLRMERLRSRYGASPLHLLAVMASFAVAGYGFFRIVESPSPLGTLIYFAAAVFAHDLIAFPLYSTLNLVAHRSAGGADRQLARPPSRPGDQLRARALPPQRHLLPPLLPADPRPRLAPLRSQHRAERRRLLTRWLGLCAVLFAGSALIYAIRLRRAGRRGDDEASGG